MPISKSKTPTKDGRCWYFRVCYKDEFNNNQRYQSKKYMTKFEAKEAEAEYISQMKSDPVKVPEKMTLGDLWESFIAYQDDKVRISTKVGYRYVEKHYKELFKIKCVDYNIHHYEAWKKVMNKKNMKDVSKNDVLKTFKAMLHYGVKIYNFNFNQVLALMEKFKSPGERKKEQDFYVFKEFEQFLSGEDEPRFIILWKTLYYCGLRIGEDRGIVPIPYSTARRRKVVVAQKAGVKEIRLHDFRHSCASLLINSGANINVVSKYLGHSDINETLNTYSHMFDSALNSVISVMNNLKAK